MSIKANLSGGAYEQQRRTFVMGDDRCPSCGRRTCPGTCDQEFYEGTGRTEEAERLYAKSEGDPGPLRGPVPKNLGNNTQSADQLLDLRKLM